MLTEVFVVNSKGHLIFRETGVYGDKRQASYVSFHQLVCSEPNLPPHFCHNGVHFYHLRSGSLRWAAAAATAQPALLIVSWLRRLRDVMAAICGGSGESALTANHLTLRQLAAEIMEDGVPLALDATRLRSLLLSRPNLALAPDLRSPGSPAAAGAADSVPQHVYLDVVETVDCVTSPEGAVERCEVSGRVDVRAGGAGCARVEVALAEHVRLLQPGAPEEAHLGVLVELRHLHPSAQRQDRWLSCPAGQLCLLQYRTLPSSPAAAAPPVSLRASACRQAGDVTVSLRLRLAVGAERQAPSVAVRFRPPAGLERCRAVCGGAGGGQVRWEPHAEEVTWTLREMPSQQEATARITLSGTDAAAADAADTLGPFRLSWEISDHTVSGLRVSAVRLPVGVGAAAARRWVRHATVSGVHTVQSVPLT